MRSSRIQSSRIKDFESDQFNNLTRQNFKCECGKLFKKVGVDEKWWKIKGHCRRCPKFVFPVTLHNWFLIGSNKILASAERKVIANLSKSRHHDDCRRRMKLTAKEWEAKTAADLISEQFGEFKIPAKEYAQLYPAYFYTICTDTIHEIEDRVIEPTTPTIYSHLFPEVFAYRCCRFLFLFCIFYNKFHIDLKIIFILFCNKHSIVENESSAA